MNPAERDRSTSPTPGTEHAVWPPRPAIDEPPVPEAEIEIQKSLDAAQKFFAMGWLFYPLYIVAMVHGLKANRLGANGRGTKYVVAGSIYIAFLIGLILFIAYTVLTHPH